MDVTHLAAANTCQTALQHAVPSSRPPRDGGLQNKNALTLSVLLPQTQETREILHFHYTTWPDFGVPESPASFLNFLFKVRESGCLNADHGPVVVHCSAGIGRSGTFCLVDTCLLLVRMKRRGKGMSE